MEELTVLTCVTNAKNCWLREENAKLSFYRDAAAAAAAAKSLQPNETTGILAHESRQYSGGFF